MSRIKRTASLTQEERMRQAIGIGQFDGAVLGLLRLLRHPLYGPFLPALATRFPTLLERVANLRDLLDVFLREAARSSAESLP